KVETLLALQRCNIDDHRFKQVQHSLQTHLLSILSYQNDNGLWNQLIDFNESEGSFHETSGSAMILYSLSISLRNHWIQWTPSIDKQLKSGVIGLTNVIMRDGSVRNITEGTGPSHSPQFYFSRSTDFVRSAPGVGTILKCLSSLISLF